MKSGLATSGVVQSQLPFKTEGLAFPLARFLGAHQDRAAV